MSLDSSERKIALCYIRLSVTKNASDLTSPERQRANIQVACDKYGWTPEWYEDAKGHKSATKEENRPEWLALKSRLRDADVAALVVNDQSRAMRNAWRAIKLFEELPSYGVKLHLAAMDRTIDISTPDGRMNAYFQAFMDDLYSLDAKRRAQDSVRYRKSKGVSIGIPPFGTVRGENGLLMPTPEGAWLMPDGSFMAGTDRTIVPDAEAVWRGYYECAELILTIYKDNMHGYEYIVHRLNKDGWAFRNRWGNPRSLKLDDVRRVVCAWREYAGMLSQGKARDRSAYKFDDPASSLQDTGRAVFDLELLKQVAQVQQSRSVNTRPTGGSRKAHIFALSNLLYCAHCDVFAAGQDDSALRSGIIGWNRLGTLRYRHSEAHRCNSGTKSVLASDIEDDFSRLVQALEIKPEAVDLMAELAVQTQFGGLNESERKEFEEQKRVAIAKHRRALKNNLMVFQDGDISAEEYYRQKDYHERQIGHWESRTSDRQKLKLELTTSMEIVKRLKLYWDSTEDEDRKILAHSLFDEIVYDLEAKHIVDYKVKVWAEPFLMLRAALHVDNSGNNEKNRGDGGSSSEVSYLSPNGKRLEHFYPQKQPSTGFFQQISFPQRSNLLNLTTT